MPRKRIIKPGFFKNDLLAGCSPLARLMFAGLWCWADRDGKLEDRPLRLKAEILPYDDADGDALIGELVKAGFVDRYEVNGVKVIRVLRFGTHQDPHPHEAKSVLPNKVNVIASNVIGEPRSTISHTSPACPSCPSCSLDTDTNSTTNRSDPLENFRTEVASLQGVEADWLRVAHGEGPDVKNTRDTLTRLVTALGPERCHDVAKLAIDAAQRKPVRQLKFFVGWLERALNGNGTASHPAVRPRAIAPAEKFAPGMRTVEIPGG